MREAPITGLSPPPDRCVPTYPVQTKDGNDHNDELDDGCHWRRRHPRSDAHAAVLDHVGRELGDHEFPTTPDGYRALLTWLRGHGRLERVGVEGTGTYGAALYRHLHVAGVQVVEVDRPDRKARRAKGKSDPLDAYSAARAALAGRATGTPKARDGRVEAIRVLRVARNSAVKARSQTTNQLKALLVSAPAELREQLRALTATVLITACARLRPAGEVADPEHATKTALRRLARRHQFLSEEISDADAELRTLVTTVAPGLILLPGVGTQVAGQLLTTVGDNPTGYIPRRRSPTCAELLLFRPAAAEPDDTDSTEAATEPPTTRSTSSSSDAYATTPAPRPTPPDAPPKGLQTRDHPLPQTLRRPRNLQRSPGHQPAENQLRRCLTIHRSIER